MALFLSVIIPAFNETSNFSKGALSQVYSYLKSQSYTWEMLLVNDGSTDNTLPQLKGFAAGKQGVRVIDNPHQGKAATIMTGVAQSRGEIILFSDMDQATPITETAKLLDKFSAGYDIVIGSRSARAGAPFFRQVLAFGMIFFRTLLLRLPYRDTQCGFKAFSSRAAKPIFSILHQVHQPKVIAGPAVNPGFDVELLYLGRKFGFKIAEVPVIWHHQDSRRVNFVRDAIAGIKELLLVRFRSFSHAYDLVKSA